MPTFVDSYLSQFVFLLFMTDFSTLNYQCIRADRYHSQSNVFLRSSVDSFVMFVGGGVSVVFFYLSSNLCCWDGCSSGS